MLAYRGNVKDSAELVESCVQVATALEDESDTLLAKLNPALENWKIMGVILW
jgi:hypothetical protein